MPLYTRTLFFLLLACCYYTNAQVVAGFTAVPSSGCAPLVVSFNNTTTPVAGTTYTWDPGNSSGTNTLTNPSTSYLAAGTYTVTLTATNGGASSTRTQVITVYPQPAVSFTESDTALCPGAPFTFTSTSAAGMPGGLSYLWSFGDGYTATMSPIVHVYDLPGRFNVSLTATNDAGCSKTTAIASLIHAYTPPVPIFSATPRHVCKHSGNVSFTSSPVGAAPFTYRWDFGDGSAPSLAANPTHFYAAPGYYAVKLVVTDAHGCMDSLLQPAYISVTTLTAGISGPDSACIYSPVTFLNASTHFLTSVWTYGNGGIDTDRDGHTSYNAIGSYTIQLIATDSFCHDTAYKAFVIARRIADFIKPEWLCPSPVAATYTAPVPAGSSVLWNFSDGFSGTGTTITHTYMTDTVFFITMTATSLLGCKDTVTKSDVVLPMWLDAGGAPDSGGCIPVNYLGGAGGVTVYPGTLPKVRYPDTFVYTWDMGDGSPLITGPLVAHTYTAVGVYDITIRTVSSHGCRDTATDNLKAGTRPHAVFTVTPTHICYRDSAIFTRMLVSGPADRYEWLFGEGANGYPTIENSSTDTGKIQHRFTVPGLMSDTLISFYNFCPDTFIRPRYVLVDSPRARGIPTVNCFPRNSVSFKDSSIGADNIMWLFGDGTTSTSRFVTHTFPASAIYRNFLTAYNIRSGCRDTCEIDVDLTPSTFSVSASDTVICKDDYVTFDIHPLSGQLINFFLLAGGRSHKNDDVFPPIFTDTFHAGGIYTIKMIGLDGHLCFDTITACHIIVGDPVPHITASPSSLCWPQVTTFYDGVTDQPGTGIASRRWTLSDGTTTVTADTFISHAFAAAGTYKIKQIVSDSIGCIDSASVTRSLYITQSIFTAPAHGCLNMDVPFVNWSTPSTSSYLWLFGDGASSTAGSQTHTYTDTGHYKVTLFVTDPHGCRDTSDQTVIVTHPHAAFSLSDSIGICTPLTVHFINSSLRSAYYLWDMGNGTSLASNPVSVYTSAGFSTVSLIAIDSFGCKDTAATKHVKVFGYDGAFSYNADSGCTPLAVTFNANLSNIALASSIVWDFDGGVTSPSSLSDTITHFYNSPGWYVPKLIIRDHSGCVSSSKGRDTIKADAVMPGFIRSPDPICIRNRIRFDDTSKSYWSHINSWRWTVNGMTSITDTTSTVFTAPGIYPAILHVTDAWGCFANDTESILVYTLPAITPTPAAIICTGQTISLTDSTPGGVWRSGSPAQASVDSANGVVEGIAAGIVIITYNTGGSCYNTIAVTVNAYPDSGLISGDSVLCVGSSILLTDSVSGGLWGVTNTNGAITSSGMFTGLIAGRDTVIYTVTTAGCSTAASRPVVVFPLPDPGTISGKDTLCINTSTILSESNTGGHWRSGVPSVASIDNGGQVRGVNTGSTTITFTTAADSNGCSNVTVFPVIVINTDISLIPTIAGLKCYGERDGSIALTVHGRTPPFTMVWSTGDTTAVIDSLPAGAFTVTVSEPATNCTLQQSFTVPSPDTLVVTAEVINDVCERPNGSIKLIPHGGTTPYHFIWSNKSVTAEIAGLTSGPYSSTVTDVNGCTAQYATILIDSTCPDIIIHDGISPNGDGINDTWVIEGLWRYPNNVVKIFDKWGDELFEATDYKNDWSGSGRNGAVPDGTYYYLVKLNTQYPPHGKDAYTGSLLIKR